METGWLIAFTVFYFVSGIAMCPVSKHIADEKGYCGIVFAVATVLFGGIGLLCACVLPNKKDGAAEAIKELVEKLSPEKKARAEASTRDVRRENSPAQNSLAGERSYQMESVRPHGSVPEAPVAYEDEGEAASLGWHVGGNRRELTPEPIAPPPHVVRGVTTANTILKDGRLVCSACLKPIGFNDSTCRYCGAKIVPADDCEGGFFLKKL